ncbi:SusD/RagB family nutrient-binding outer membrane lipoprotein [Reichenbachiella sp. MALMAid0571]|uniref:SusD/RagB family nutrient-binding outer membrane lipoprotein n=1 Tax=Reichenbachiella sp. MALMAid0571 TaxID=3143939 RepID=UPI0032DE61E0
MKKIKIIISAIVLCVMSFSCDDDFAELNTDPTQPLDTNEAFLFAGVLSSMPFNNNQVLYLDNHNMYQWSQLSASTGGPEEIINFAQEAVWNQYYSMLRTASDLEARLLKESNQDLNINRKGMLMIVKAYMALKATDLYGPMPYFEAGLGATSEVRPEYTSQADIYASALEDLKWAADNMTTDSDQFSYGSGDVIYNGDITQWRKLANSLRLRYALRMSNVDETAAKAIISEILAPTEPLVMTSASDNLEFTVADGFGVTLYYGFQYYEGIRMGEVAWGAMTEGDPSITDGSNIIDPRVHIYFETNEDDEWVAMPQSPADRDLVTNHPYDGPRRGQDDSFSFRGNYSAFNWYLVNGPANGNAGAQVHIGYPEVCFLIAEAYQRGFATGNAQEWYEKGIRASMDQWYEFGAGGRHLNDLWETAPAKPSDAEIDAYIANSKIAYNTTDGLKLIHTQRWLNSFLNSEEAFHLYRRSGLTPRVEVRDDVSNDLQDPRRITYPADEVNNNYANYSANTARLTGGDKVTSRVWWDVN